jgi:catechol 2,3-dioxygenase-like lactoylglutathione lyase family enzyme
MAANAPDDRPGTFLERLDGPRDERSREAIPEPSTSSPPIQTGDREMTMTSPAALHHTCFLVRDLEASAQALSDSLGIGPWNVWTIEPAECRVRGRETRFSIRLALATVGGGTFELITPHTGNSVFDEQLASHGEGFHHTCLVYPTIEAVREAKAELVRQGREMIQEASAGDVFEFGFFSFPEIGSVVELLYLDASQLPPPEVVIGEAAPAA